LKNDEEKYVLLSLRFFIKKVLLSLRYAALNTKTTNNKENIQQNNEFFYFKSQMSQEKFSVTKTKMNNIPKKKRLFISTLRGLLKLHL
jgi:hypothetical protein